jgi:hypothetical protein
MENMMMASAPDAMDERNQVMEAIAMKQFGKPLNELSDDEIIQIEMMIDEMVKRKDQPREMAQAGGRVGFQTGGITESRTLTTRIYRSSTENIFN